MVSRPGRKFEISDEVEISSDICKNDVTSTAMRHESRLAAQDLKRGGSTEKDIADTSTTIDDYLLRDVCNHQYVRLTE